MDCGPCCLCAVLKYYGQKWKLSEFKEKCYVNRGGVSLVSLCEAAELVGFHSMGVKLIWQQLCTQVKLPCIIHWNQNHFVVVYKIEKRRGRRFVYVSDPAAGLLKYTEEAFLKSWLEIKGVDGQPDKGIARLLEPTPASSRTCSIP